MVRVRVRSSPFFKAGQNLLNIGELVLDVRKHCLGPQQDISWRGNGGEGKRVRQKQHRMSLGGFIIRYSTYLHKTSPK